MRVLTCIGDATSIDTWSSIPYYFLRAGRRAGFFQGGWAVHPRRLRLHRAWWNMRRLVRTGWPAGYQYSRSFLDHLLRQVDNLDGVSEVISHFPLFPPVDGIDAAVTFYIDATLKQNFVDYRIACQIPIGRDLIEDALDQERAQYHAARRIVCMSRWAARSVVQDYGIEAHKVHVIPGGANLIDDDLLLPSPEQPRPLEPVRLGFIGKDWRRKNLPFVLRVAEILRSRGHAVEVVAAGFAPDEGPRHPLVRTVGFIDKHSDLETFIRLVRSFHFGCLFSTVEAFGISNRECLRLGVPVLGRDIGGIPDTIPPGLGHLFAADAAPDEVAAVIADYVREPECYLALCRQVAAHAGECSWQHTVCRFGALWAMDSQDAPERGATLHD
jgi:glycosyltransferase involved in cell wall biosynthesis